MAILHDTENHPNLPHLIGTIHTEQFPHPDGPMHNKYYIIKYGPTMHYNQFLHKDGTWHDHCGPNGAYNTKPEAHQILAKQP